MAGPLIGTEQAFQTQTLTLGSSTAIACVLMQRLGLKTAMSALIGDDDHGAYCKGILIDEGVDMHGVRTHATLATGITISLSYPGDRMLLTRYGTMTAFGVGDIDAVQLRAARHLHVGSYFIQTGLQPDLARLFKDAQGRGQTTSLDLGWDPRDAWDTVVLRQVLPHVSVVFPNRDELAAVTGTRNVDAGIARLHRMGATTIALKLGAAGAVLSGGGPPVRHGGFPITVVDTTGAGDAFNAGYIRGLLDGASPQSRLALGNACGALTATGTGGIGGLKDLSAAQALIAG